MLFTDPEPKPEETSAEEQTDFADAFASRTTEDEGENTGDKGEPSQDDTKPADAEPASEAAAPAAAQNGSDDPFAGMTPEQKSYWSTVLHSERSNRGRVAALTKKVQASPAQTAPAATTETASDDNGSDQAADLEAKLKTAAEEYPDAVGPLVEVIADIRKSIAGLNQSVAPIVEDQDSAAMAKAYADLEKAHPDYRAVAADPNWHAWIADQPEKVQQLAESYDPREVSLTIALFKTERQAAVLPGEGEDPTLNATEEKRKRQLDGGKDVSSKNIPAAAGVPDDFGAAFNARAQKGA